LQAPLDDFLRDFANPRPSDAYFPLARGKDWFDGHSWASGYTVFAAGKNQASAE
jgi:endo-1,3(4)-beta-glucanase